MKEINDEIELTLNLMQTDVSDGTHEELQFHLYGLLDMKRNVIRQRLTGSWSVPISGTVETVTLGGQNPYKGKPLTPDELMDGGWRCEDISEECRRAFVEKGIPVLSDDWSGEGFEYCFLEESEIVRSTAHLALWSSMAIKQIHRIGNEFYWSEE